MAGTISRFVAGILNATTPPGGSSLLPRWMIRPMSYVAIGRAVNEWTRDDAHQVMVNEAVGQYRALATRLGQAGIAVPWRRSADGTQAIQVLPQPETEAQRTSLRTLGNYLQLITMNHPGLAPIMETAYHQGYPYLVARLSSSAHAMLRPDAMPVDSRLAQRIVRQIAEALEYAHHRDVLHGALALEDIFLDDRGNVSVLGIGLNQLQQDLGALPDRLAQSPLTPPEVAAGATPDKRSDVYAVAALFYLLLTGEPPVPDQPVDVSQQSPEIPAPVDAVLARALAAEPDQRYEDLISMNWDLHLALRAPRESRRSQSASQAQKATPLPDRAEPRAARRAEPARPPAISGFPEPLPMPVIDTSTLQQAFEAPEIPTVDALAIPEPPPIPAIVWDDLLKPLDLERYSSLNIETPDDAFFERIPDPFDAAAEAARAKAAELEPESTSEVDSASPEADQPPTELAVRQPRKPINP